MNVNAHCTSDKYAFYPCSYSPKHLSIPRCTLRFHEHHQFVDTKKGHRLGTANENATRQHNNNNSTDNNNSYDIPKPIIDENLTDADREKIRADRAAAAEARLKKQGLPIKPPKKTPPVDPNAPLRGPNSKPTMTWSLG